MGTTQKHLGGFKKYKFKFIGGLLVLAVLAGAPGSNGVAKAESVQNVNGQLYFSSWTSIKPLKINQNGSGQQETTIFDSDPASGGAPNPRTRGLRYSLQNPVFSSDGRRVAYVNHHSGDSYDSIQIKKVASAEPAFRLFSGSKPEAIGFDWSPDDNWISYFGADGLHIVHPNGTGDRLVTAVAPDEYSEIKYSTWLPDSKTIIYDEYANNDISQPRFCRVNITTSVKVCQRPVINVPNFAGNVTALSVSGDGKKVAFRAVVDDPSLGYDKIFIGDVASNGAISNIRMLPIATIFNDNTQELVAGFAWSPDSQQFVYRVGNVLNHVESPNTGIYIANANGYNARRISTDPSMYDIGWRPVIR